MLKFVDVGSKMYVKSSSLFGALSHGLVRIEVSRLYPCSYEQADRREVSSSC